MEVKEWGGSTAADGTKLYFRIKESKGYERHIFSLLN